MAFDKPFPAANSRLAAHSLKRAKSSKVAECQKVMRVKAVLNKSPDFLGRNFFYIRMPTKSLGALPVNITLNLNCCEEMCITGAGFAWLLFFVSKQNILASWTHFYTE